MFRLLAATGCRRLKEIRWILGLHTHAYPMCVRAVSCGGNFGPRQRFGASAGSQGVAKLPSILTSASAVPLLTSLGLARPMKESGTAPARNGARAPRRGTK